MLLIIIKILFLAIFEMLCANSCLLKLHAMSSSLLSTLDLLNCFYPLKLRALSHILQTPIEVVQMDSPPIIVGEEYSGKPIILV